MANIKPSARGIVVEHLESGTRYAVSDKNYNAKVHRKVRDLRPGETVLGYQPKRREAGSEPEGGTNTPEAPAGSESDGSEALSDAPATSGKATPTEGSASVGTKGK